MPSAVDSPTKAHLSAGQSVPHGSQVNAVEAERNATPEKGREPPMKKRRVSTKSAEEVAAAEVVKAEKAAAKAVVKEKEKQEKAAARVAAKEEKAAAAAAAKAETQAMKQYLKNLGDNIKGDVQCRSTSASYTMTPAQYEYVFGDFLPERCTKKITTEITYPDGRPPETTVVTKEIEPLGSPLSLSERQVQTVFGIGKTKGGSYNRWHGATEWNIVSMTVKPPSAMAQVELKWQLSDGALWRR